MRKFKFYNGEIYHIYNRGTDKRNIVSNIFDTRRFFQSMKDFNSVKPIGSLYELSFCKHSEVQPGANRSKPLVRFITFCINPNHFHLVLKQVHDGGISEFMKRLSGGYTWYFNNRYKRSGVLFQGKFKATHVSSDNYLLRLSAYVNLNNKVHQLGGSTAKLVINSWEEYVDENFHGYPDHRSDFCDKDIILKQFSGGKDYKRFALGALADILNNKEQDKELRRLLEE